jgi:hypothetical protein
MPLHACQSQPSRDNTNCSCVAEGHLSHAYADTEERQRYSFSTFPSMVLEGVGGGQHQALAALPQRKTHYQCQFMGLSYGRDGPRIVI